MYRAPRALRRVVLAALPVVFAFAALLSVFGWVSAPTTENAAADVISGKARVIDGDTLEVADQRIRLHGIDAPESEQFCNYDDGRLWPCGERATTVMKDEIIAGRAVECETRTRDRYGRWIAVCDVDGTDINEALVERGLALAYCYYSDDYGAVEKEAAKKGRGMWRGSFDEPRLWRRNMRLKESVEPGCD